MGLDRPRGIRIMPETHLTQSDKFKALARELEMEEDEMRWDERLTKVVAYKPVPDMEKPE